MAAIKAQRDRDSKTGLAAGRRIYLMDISPPVGLLLLLTDRSHDVE